jgi:hypothetical protein
MNEIWKDIQGYEGLYLVSNLGRVKRMYKNRPSVIRKGTIDKDGYLRIGLSKDCKYKYFYIHRLVAMSFIENAENKPCINHINGIKNDNRIDNIEWCTYSENIRHADKTGLRACPKGKDCHMFGKLNGLHHNSKIVLNTQTGIYYDCAKEAAKAHQYKYSTLKSYLNGGNHNKTSLIYV